MSAFPQFNAGEQFILEWQYRMLGGFGAALAEAIAKADVDNLERLRQGFPHEVDAFIAFSRVPGWWESLQERANLSQR